MGLIEEIKDILPYIRIAHHIPGRIRLKLDMKGLKKLPLSELNGKLKGIKGIENIRINPLARSVIIYYNPKNFSISQIEKFISASSNNTPSTLLKLFERLSNVDFETELTKVKNSFSQDNPKLMKSLKAMKNLLESDNSPETIRQALNVLFPELPSSTRSAIVNLYERFVVIK